MNAVVCVHETKCQRLGFQVAMLCGCVITSFSSFYSFHITHLFHYIYIYIEPLFSKRPFTCIYVYMFTFGGYIWQYELLQ